MKKHAYIAPEALVVRLNISHDITEDIIGIGSKHVDSSEIEGKGTDFEEDGGNDWGGYRNDFTQNWISGNIHRQWDDM